MNSVTDAHPGEVELDFAREWVEFYDPDNPEHLIAADLTWLLSRWTCVFGTPACQGTVAGRPDDGCCSHGAFLSDDDDRARLDDAVKQLTDEDWQFREKGLGRKGYLEMDEYDGKPNLRTRKYKGACVLPEPTRIPRRHRMRSAQQGAQAGRRAVDDEARCVLAAAHSPHSGVGGRGPTAPRCSRRGSRSTTAAAGVRAERTCTGTAPATPTRMSAPRQVWESYAPELTELLGEKAYSELAAMCKRRERFRADRRAPRDPRRRMTIFSCSGSSRRGRISPRR